jgi:hypothetical protein
MQIHTNIHGTKNMGKVTFLPTHGDFIAIMAQVEVNNNAACNTKYAMQNINVLCAAFDSDGKSASSPPLIFRCFQLMLG